MAGEQPRQYHPLTCHGHSRPVPHVSFSPLEKDGVYYMISACKGTHVLQNISQSAADGRARQQPNAARWHNGRLVSVLDSWAADMDQIWATYLERLLISYP